jgi:hypothetical protein
MIFFILTLLSCYAYAKQPLIEGLIDVSYEKALNSSFSGLDARGIIDDTYDGDLLTRYYNIFTADLQKMNNVDDILYEEQHTTNLNNRALMYFLGLQSLVIDQVRNPYERGRIQFDL